MKVAYNLYNKEVAYFFGPKCGSRTIIGWGALLIDPDAITKHPEWFQESREGSSYPETGDMVQSISSNADGYKIKLCVVRDPIERFISAYTNRVLYHKFTKSIVSIDEVIDRETRRKDADFIDIDMHTEPLVNWYGNDPSFYTHVYNIKQLPSIKEMLENISGKRLPDIKLQQSGNVEKPILTKKQQDCILELYKQDYEIYGKWM